MSRTHIAIADRRLVRERANGRCEYCLIHEDDAALRHENDHIIAEKHGGATTLENLAYACFLCNNGKGSDLSSLSSDGTITRLFHPRNDDWNAHFLIADGQIISRTKVGEATDRILAFNTRERQDERRGLQELGRYPTGI